MSEPVHIGEIIPEVLGEIENQRGGGIMSRRPKTKTCPECDGTKIEGYDENDKPIECHVCDGTGEVDNDCPVCAGSGGGRDEWQCRSCHGSGLGA